MRKLPPSPSLKRVTETIAPRVAIHIVCEGINTEPEYFICCKDHYGSGMIDLKIVPGAGVPRTLVDTAVALRQELIAKKRKSKDSFDACFRVWAVFDRDEHPLVEEALVTARDNSIDVAFSDPCFEVWPLLHLVDHGSQDDRHEVHKKLSELMPGYDHNKGAIINYGLIKDSFDQAYQRAERLNKKRVEELCPHGRPSTTVGNLVLKIIQNGKKASTAKKQ